MLIHLPIADISTNILLILATGGGIGVLSGLLGVGGGFLLTPLLIVLGVPPPVAVGTGANHLVGTSISGAIAHSRRGNVDFKMGLLLLLGGIAGSSLGVAIFALLAALGQLDLTIHILYVVLLGAMGFLMARESITSFLRRRQPRAVRRKLHEHTWIHGLPFRTRFRRSRLYISALLPLTLGAMIGVLSSIMGVGGSFILVPAMILILGMPTEVVVGTSLFQTVFVAANTTLLQATVNQSVDLVLGILLVAGGVIGAQLGARWSGRMAGSQIRALFAILVLGLCAQMLFYLVSAPGDPFSVQGLLD